MSKNLNASNDFGEISKGPLKTVKIFIERLKGIQATIEDCFTSVANFNSISRAI